MNVKLAAWQVSVRGGIVARKTFAGDDRLLCNDRSVGGTLGDKRHSRSRRSSLFFGWLYCRKGCCKMRKRAHIFRVAGGKPVNRKGSSGDHSSCRVLYHLLCLHDFDGHNRKIPFNQSCSGFQSNPQCSPSSHGSETTFPYKLMLRLDRISWDGGNGKVKKAATSGIQSRELFLTAQKHLICACAGSVCNCLSRPAYRDLRNLSSLSIQSNISEMEA